ncbi:hypothetical protein Poli38472_009358 [Pythium oligandrum]|uniref:DDE Tnp4 domain-containing protein n=1 Tax=Pythium oligandrum TaxID=41045 RepID=A0A8K1FJQ8_PYTOL|nr:hypothetical protein Poli38472_009358 [Pythium oligandrum]|eukprot:TMW65191.1 hypothetical protein Poli38472_009358 [Pythium oligandrum]
MAMLYDELDDSEDEDEDEVPSRVTRAKPTPQLNWGKVYKARDVATYVEIVSIPPDAYDRLLTAFARHYVVTSAAGGASQLTTNHVLACLLIFYTHGATKKRLSELFGVSPALVSRILQHAEAALKKALKEIPEAKTKWPTCEQQREWAAAVQVKEPSITGCFAVAKCERFKVHKSTKREREQGWFATTQVNSVFCYGLDGTILFGELNHPIERFEDDLSSSLEDRFRNKQGGRCVVDTAFPICDPDSPEKHILRPLSSEELETAYPDELARHFAIEAIHRCPELASTV